MGGCSVTAGYFNNEAKTNEVYKVVFFCFSYEYAYGNLIFQNLILVIIL